MSKQYVDIHKSVVREMHVEVTLRDLVGYEVEHDITSIVLHINFVDPATGRARTRKIQFEPSALDLNY